ncbi:sigma-70 family RNA polymerase sigma factor [Marinobacterium mangrovicola]|uniref:RNA polymerase sigma-70 factor (ECF subfamily) n=1 Tax=Marinobacterium mangrovicola TaxID=1476959 RepID=A0A4R1GJN4_9GAMM|nr:sigma-70 family RNA polymerase sigma factor [Marinobacterium mangrovicola]TCK07471.1 RNA polymerase sigma-70 factor (ECF subfamily) [Marinobacterium mangrovicola]
MSGTDSAHSSDIHNLYTHHSGWLHSWLRKRLGCSETAADLAQDTYLRVLQRDRCGIRVREPRAYLAKIAKGLMINHWRRLDIERAYLDALSVQPDAVSPSAEEHHLVIEALLEIDALLRRLPEKPRRAFLMSRLDGHTYAQIGEALGVSERMVKKYMAQAMYHLLVIAEV